MKRYALSALVVFLLCPKTHAQNIDLEILLTKADQASSQYIRTFKDLVAEEMRTYDYFRKDESLEESRKIRSIFIVYQSPKNNLVAEYRNVTEFNGKTVARGDDSIAKFFEKLSKASSSEEEIWRINKEGDRFDGKSHSHGMTLVQAFILNRYFRPFFEFRIVGKETIEGRDVTMVEYTQTKPTLRIKANATDDEKKLEPNGISFDAELPSNFRPTNPRLHGKLWLDAETGQLWRNEFSVTIQPATFSKPVVSANLSYEYQSSEFGVLLPKKFWVVGYRFSGKSEKDLARNKTSAKSFEYSKFSRPASDVKDAKTEKGGQ